MIMDLLDSPLMYINNKNIKARRMKRRGDCPTVRSKHADVTERVNERFARGGYAVSGVLEGLEPGWRSPETYKKIFTSEMSGKGKGVALFRLEFALCVVEAL
jgi:hypothetical protein